MPITDDSVGGRDNYERTNSFEVELHGKMEAIWRTIYFNKNKSESLVEHQFSTKLSASLLSSLAYLCK